MANGDHSHGHNDRPNDRSTIDGGSESKIPGAESKGKRKANEASMVDRLQASGKMAVNAMTASQDMPTVAPGSKTSGSSRNITQSSTMSGESSSRMTSQTGLSESLRTAKDSRDSSDAFDAFTNRSQALLPREAFSIQMPSKSIAEQEASDGAAVVELLSVPDDPSDMLQWQGEDGCLSPAEAERLHEALFMPSDTPWQKLLDFMPDFLVHPDASGEAADHLGTADAGTARDLWVQQWSDVLEAYNNHVWGDLEPLVVQAKLEVSQLAAQRADDDEVILEAKALGRLRQILAHVRGCK